MVIALLLASCTSTGSSLNSTETGALSGLNVASPPSLQPTVQAVGAKPIETSSGSSLALNQSSSIATTGQQLPATTALEVGQVDPNAKLIKTAIDAAANNSNNLGTTTTATPQSASVALTQPSPTQLPATLTAPTPNSDALLNKNPIAETGLQNTLTKQAGKAPNTQSQPVLTATPAGQKLTTEELAGQDAAISDAAAQAPVPAVKEKKKSLFDALFAPSKNKIATPEQPTLGSEPIKLALAEQVPSKASASIEPVLQPPAKLDLSKLNKSGDAQEEVPQSDNSENGELPGVRKGALFEIKRRDSIQDDTDVDIGETDSGPVLLASAGGLARLAPNGLRVQRESVEVACIKPQLVKLLKNIERHYGSQVIVSSGYRSPGYNRRVRGAKNSLHMFCAAVDIQVVGVSKWQLAKYARSMPGRGGVGTYCHTDSVHIDVGPDRDWNWRCARRK